MKLNTKNVFVFSVLIVVGVFLILSKNYKTQPINNISSKPSQVVPISISQEPIKEENFTGTNTIIEGSSVIAVSARKYIADSIAEFKKNADIDVPKMRKDFGPDAPTGKYYIDFSAKYLKGNTTESIVVSQYTYTGGANGMEVYKVFTSSISGDALLSLSSIIKPDKKDAFVSYLKKALTDWRPYDATDTVVFPDSVNSLTFDSISSWSLDDKNLTIYFDKYEIGPGVLGAVIFPISVSSIKDYVVNKYLVN